MKTQVFCQKNLPISKIGERVEKIKLRMMGSESFWDKGRKELGDCGNPVILVFAEQDKSSKTVLFI